MLIKTTRTAVLTVAALDLLYVTEEGCCPTCCNFCWVLQDMYRRNLLDKTVMEAPVRMYEDQEWWDSDHQAVKRTWLTNQWLRKSCDHGLKEDQDEETREQPGLDPVE